MTKPYDAPQENCTVASNHNDMPAIYSIEQRIETLAENAILEKGNAASFTALGVEFSHWDFNLRDGWLQNYWLAKETYAAANVESACQHFNEKLKRIVPRVALVSQCYTEWRGQPYLIVRADLSLGYYGFIRNTNPVGLMFMEDEVKALNLLLDKPIPEAFYYYWNDAVNTIGYSSKLLLMFCAIEALVKVPSEKGPPTKDWGRLESILGAELKAELFGTKETPGAGVRHRLVHGDYFNQEDSQKNYLLLVHQCILDYYNDQVFGEPLLGAVTHPQRHLFGNREQWRGFIRPISDKPLTLKAVLENPDEGDVVNSDFYQVVYDKAVTKQF